LNFRNILFFRKIPTVVKNGRWATLEFSSILLENKKTPERNQEQPFAATGVTRNLWLFSFPWRVCLERVLNRLDESSQTIKTSLKINILERVETGKAGQRFQGRAPERLRLPWNGALGLGGNHC
jgi:hypothetical protein